MSIRTWTDRSYLQGESSSSSSSSSASAERREDAGSSLEAFEKLGRLGEIDQAVEIAEKIPPGKEKWSTCCKVALALAKEDHVDQALRILKIIPGFSFESEEPCVEILKFHVIHAIGYVAADIGDFSLAFMIWGILPGERDGVLRLISYIFKQCARTDDVFKVTAFASLISNKDLRSQLLQEVFEELISAGRFYDAFVVAREVPGRPERHEFLKRLSSQLEPSSQPEIDHRFALDMGNLEAHFYDKSRAGLCLTADLKKYLDILEDLAILDRVDKTYEAVMKTLEILERIESEYDKKSAFLRTVRIAEKFNPTGLVLTKVCETLVKSGKLDQAVKTAELIFNYELRLNLFKNILKNLTTDSEIDKFIVGAKSLLERYDSQKIIADMFKELAMTGEVDKAIAFKRKIQSPKESKLQEIARELAAVGKVDEAFKVAIEIWAEKEMRHAVLKDLSSRAELAPFFDRELIFAETISNRNEKLFAYFSILEDLIACDKLDKTDVVIEKIYELTKMYYEESRSQDFARRACQILAEIGKVNQAIEFARIIDHPVTRSQLLLTICKILAKANQSAQALSVLREFGNNPVGRSEALEFILKALTTRGQVDEVIEIAKVVSDPERCQLEFGEIIRGVFSIVAALAEAGYFEKAREVIQGICPEDEKSDAFSELFYELIKAHRIDEALEIVEMCSEGFEKSQGFLLISKEFATAHRFDEALKIADMISDENEKAEAFCVISEKCAEKGLVDRAIELMKVTSKASSERKFTALRAILKALETVDHLDLVGDYTRSLSDQKYSKILFMELFRRFIAMGRIDKALEISRDVFEPFSLSEISEKLKALGKMDEAKEIGQRILAEKKLKHFKETRR